MYNRHHTPLLSYNREIIQICFTSQISQKSRTDELQAIVDEVDVMDLDGHEEPGLREKQMGKTNIMY
jgi:hypothetical protein